VEIGSARRFRRRLVPAGHDENSWPQALTMEGASYGRRLPNVIERIDHELDVIKSMGFLGVLSSGTRALRKSRIRGRGGSAATRVSTPAHRRRRPDQRPPFERMLNPGRQQMPDIDMDFDSVPRRDDGTARRVRRRPRRRSSRSPRSRRAAVRDAARVLGYPIPGDKIAVTPLIMGRDTRCTRFEQSDKYADGYNGHRLRTSRRRSDAKRIDVARSSRLRRQDGIHGPRW
jgi:DNA polymerase-3 subunit alpha